MQKFLRNIALIVLLFSSGKYTSAQEIKAWTDSTEYLIGTWIPLHIEITTPRDAKIKVPIWDKMGGGFEFVNDKNFDTIEGNNEVKFIFNHNIIAFDTGYQTISPLRFEINYANGNIDSVFTQPIRLNIVSVPVDTSKGLKIIKPPIKVPITFRKILPWLLAALAIISLIALFFWWRKRPKKVKPEVDKSILANQTPFEWAIAELKRVKSGSEEQNGDIKWYYTELSNIVRTFIEKQMNVPAMESTTDEVIDGLRRKQVHKSELKSLNSALSLADMVKFAKATPGKMEHEDTYEKISHFIYLFKPKSEQKEGDDTGN